MIFEGQLIKSLIKIKSDLHKAAQWNSEVYQLVLNSI